MNSTVEANPGPAQHWTVAEEKQPRPAAVEVVLHKRTYIFPWSRFIYAEGASDEAMISFATHEVVVTGYGLEHLLTDVAAQRIVALHEPHRADQFRAVNETEPKAAFHKLVVRQVLPEE